MIALSACQTGPQPTRSAEPMPGESTGVDQSGGTTQSEISLASALELLQSGEESAALAVLEQLDAERPGSVAARIRRQIESPVEELIPGPYETITIEAGETLSEIALRVLDDPLMFYALARLNRIEEPRLVSAGESIRVPRRPDRATTDPEPVAQPRTPESPESRVEDIDTVARYLARSGRPDEGWRMLLLEIESGTSGAALAGSLTELTLSRAGELQAQEQFDEAAQRLDRVIQALDAGDPNQALLEQKLAEVRGQHLLSQARRAQADNELTKAYRLVLEANRTGAAPDADGLVDYLRNRLIDSLHNDALIAWRDRDVDRAIRHWETLLESVPDFEPAKVYLDRARRLRARLDQS